MKINPAAAAGLLAILCFFSGCSLNKGLVRDAFREPLVSVEKASLSGFDLEQASVVLDLAVENPNPFAIRLKRVAYRLCVNTSNRTLLEGTNESLIEIPASGRSVVSFPLTIRYSAITNLDWSSTNLTYVFQGTAALDTVLGPLPVAFRHEGSIPLPRLPTVRLEKIEAMNFSPLDLKGAFELTIFISNANTFPLTLRNLDYDLSLNASSLSRGRTKDDRMAVEAVSSGRFYILVDIDFSLLKDLARIVLQGSRVRFGFSGTYDIDGIPAVDGFFNFSDNGSTVIRK